MTIGAGLVVSVASPLMYQAVAASQAAKLLGTNGKQGDYLHAILLIPATTSPGAVQITDGNGTAITIFTGGATSVADLKPIWVPINAKCTAGTTPGWYLTTGANISAIAFGDFT